MPVMPAVILVCDMIISISTHIDWIDWGASIPFELISVLFRLINHLMREEISWNFELAIIWLHDVKRCALYFDVININYAIA